MTKHFFKAIIVLFVYTTSLAAHHPYMLNGTTENVLDFVATYLPKNPIIIEAGAFDGQDTVKMSKKWPKSKIYCFEPVEEAYNKLIINTKKHKNIHQYKLALGDFNGKSIFYISDFYTNPEYMTAGSSLLKPGKDNYYASGMSFTKTIEVDVITLDEWAKKPGFKHIDFMWLDMQGYELNTLKCSSLALTARVIYTEMEFVEAYEGQFLYQDVLNWMEENGFKLVAIDFEPDQPLKKIEPAQIYTPGKAWFGNGVFINTRYFD